MNPIISPQSPGKGQVARAAGVMAALTLVSRILGMLRDMVIASSLGAGFISDAFFVAFRIPNLLRRVVAEGSLSSAFVPVFAEDLNESKEAARKTLAAVSALTLLLTVPLTLLGMYYAEGLVHFLSPGFGVHTEKSELAKSLLIVMFPYAILISFVALASSALNAVGSFGLPSLPPIILNVVVIASIVIFGDKFARPVFAPASGVVLGGALSLILLWWELRKQGYSLFPSSPWRSLGAKRMMRLFFPALLAASLHQVIVFVNSLLASTLEEGSISWLYYADRIFQFPLGVFSIALATAALPRLSRLAAQNRDHEMTEELGVFLSWITVLTVPAAFALIGFAEPITSLMYERGSFGESSTLQTASALACYSVGLWTISCHSVVVRAFLAKKNSTIPSVVSILSIIINVVLAIALMGPTEGHGESVLARSIASLQHSLNLFSFGHAGIALAGSLASFFSFYALVALLPRVGLNCYFDDLMPPIVKSLASSLVMLLGLKALMLLEMPRLLEVAIGIPFGGVIYFVTAHLLKLPHTETARTILSDTIKKWRNKSTRDDSEEALLESENLDDSGS